MNFRNTEKENSGSNGSSDLAAAAAYYAKMLSISDC
jgi:hypothetical protein